VKFEGLNPKLVLQIVQLLEIKEQPLQFDEQEMQAEVPPTLKLPKIQLLQILLEYP